MSTDVAKLRSAIDKAIRYGMDSTGYRPTGAEVKVIVDEVMAVAIDAADSKYDAVPASAVPVTPSK